MTTTTDVAVRNGHGTAALAIRPGQEMFNDKQRAALAVLGIKDATNADLAVYMHYCQKTGLDPFSRQIYMIARREKQGNDWITKQTIQVGIDGFRVIRDRAAKRDGVTVEYEDTIWYDGDGQPHHVWLWEDAPAACKVVLIKHTPTGSLRYPAVLRTAAYMATKDGKPVSQWKTQAEHMIEKCCEAFACRRAFPNDLGGIYLEDEMPPPPVVPVRPTLRVTAADITGQPESPPREQTSGPAVPDGTPGSGPAAGPETKGQPAPKGMALKLDKLLASLPLGPEEDVRALLEHLSGGPWTATRAQVALVTGILEDHLRVCQGDAAEAASAVWAQYRAATAHAGAEGSQDAGSDG